MTGWRLVVWVTTLVGLAVLMGWLLWLAVRIVSGQ